MSPAPRLVCLGNLSLDDVAQPGGLQRVGVAHPGVAGGDALYGVLAARLVLPGTAMLAPVGRDLPPDIDALLASYGLSSEGMPRRDRPTLRNRIVYETHDRRVVTLLSEAADFELLSPRSADMPARYWAADAFMILAMTLDAQRDLVEGCRARAGTRPGALVALDPQEEYIEGNVEAILDLVARVDVFMPSLDEVRRLLGHAEPARAARQLAALGPGIVVVKMGAEGSLIHQVSTGRDIVMPAYPVRPLDTTGAGDAYCSAFMASLVTMPDDLPRAAAAGAVAASYAVCGYGIDGLASANAADFGMRLEHWLKRLRADRRR